MRRIPSGQQSSSLSRSSDSLANQLINAKTAGDAGNRSDHFLGTSLGGQWTATTTGGSGTVSVKNSVLAFKSPAGQSCLFSQAFTPSGAFRVEARLGSTTNPIHGAAIGGGTQIWVSDTTNVASFNYVGVEFNLGFLVNKAVAGTYSGLTEIEAGYGFNAWQNAETASSPSGASPGLIWGYVSLERDGSNNWTAQGSWDRNLWTTIGTVSAFTFTPGFMFIQGFDNTGSFFIDFIDVVR